MEEQTIFEIIHSMDKVTNKLIVQWNKAFGEELGVSYILILGYLSTNGQSRPSDIAKQIGYTPPTVTHLTEKLVKKGLIIRVVSESDRRMTYLEITQEGLKILKKANETGKKLRKNLFENLTDEEKENFSIIYKKLSNM